MKLARRLRPSLRALLSHKIRALLAVSSVAAGVAAVFLTSAIGKGAQDQVLDAIESMGTNLLIVKPVQVKRLAARKTIRGLSTTLTEEDYQAITELALVQDAAPGADRPMRVKAAGTATVTTVRGTTTSFPHVRRFEIASGRFFDADETTASRRVAVLGARVKENLFQDQDPVGGSISIAGVPFDVVGVLCAKGVLGDGSDEDNQILVPIRTALRRLFNVDWLTTVFVSVREPQAMDAAEVEIRTLLRDRHRLPPGLPPQRGSRVGASGVEQDAKADDFAIQNTAKSRAMQQEMAESLTLVTIGMAALALLVGGTGILALMLLSVRERVGEIGLRMAVGATPAGIFVQFLIEATLLALGGWVSGIMVGATGAAIVAFGTSWNVGVPVPALLASLGMTAAIGFGFGTFPAWRAACMPPIEALGVE
jgi:putative ABC transport system permease protein